MVTKPHHNLWVNRHNAHCSSAEESLSFSLPSCDSLIWNIVVDYLLIDITDKGIHIQSCANDNIYLGDGNIHSHTVVDLVNLRLQEVNI